MTILVGMTLDGRRTAALRLGVALALSSGRPLRLCTVISATAAMRGVDADYLDVLESTATESLRQAMRSVNPSVDATVEVRQARSVSRGLLAAAEESDVGYVVLGSSPSGSRGRVALGGVSDRLLHGAKVPVAIAPRDYSIDPSLRISRVTVAYGRSSPDGLIVAATAEATELRAGVRLASFAVHPAEVFGGAIDGRPEALVVDRWAQAQRREAEEALTRARRLYGAGTVDMVVGQGNSWHEAVADVPWRRGDVLVVGSGGGGRLSQVYLGAQASKIIRHAPVPVVCVPRGAEK